MHRPALLPDEALLERVQQRRRSPPPVALPEGRRNKGTLRIISLI